MLKKIYVCIVGVGSIAEQFHIPIILSDSRCKLTALIEKDDSRRSYVSKKYGIPCLKTIEDVKEADLCVVTCPPSYRREIILPALEKGMHVFCEKPLAYSLFEANEMLTYAKSKGKRLLVGYTRRFFPNLSFIRNILRSCLFTSPIEIIISEGVPYKWHAISDYRSKLDPRDAGVIHDQGAHIIDLVNLFFEDMGFSTNDLGIEDVVVDRENQPNTCSFFIIASNKQNQISCRIIFSRQFYFLNKIIIITPRLKIMTSSLLDNKIEFRVNNSISTLNLQNALYMRPCSLMDCFRLQWDDVIQTILREKRGEKSLTDAETVLSSIKLIDLILERKVVRQLDIYFINENW